MEVYQDCSFAQARTYRCFCLALTWQPTICHVATILLRSLDLCYLSIRPGGDWMLPGAQASVCSIQGITFIP
eukprot:scaffold6954_cov24-Tisochrysis_lutea.AAC.2